MKKWFPFAIVAGAILISLFMAIGTYNRLVTKQEAAKTAWSQVENQYQRRFDLIPNLVETVKGFAAQVFSCPATYRYCLRFKLSVTHY